MGAGPSEPCIYEKLAVSVEVLRRSGEHYGMSERDIERFVAQILETNEPQREARRFPRLLAAVKILIALGLLIITACSFISPYSRSHYQSKVTEDQDRKNPIIGHIRLLHLPIAKKYNLEVFHDWGHIGCEHLIPNCTECASLSAVGTVSDRKHISKYNHRIIQPIVIKSGSAMSLSYGDLKRLHSEYREAMDVYLEDGGNLEDIVNKNSVFPEESNLIIHWRKQRINGMHILRAIFPNSSMLPFENKVTLKKCLITPSRGSPFQFLSHQLHIENSWLVVGRGNLKLQIKASEKCAEQCGSFLVQLGEGDIVYANSNYWQMTISPAGEQTLIICVGSI
ncbi:bombesin receptor-activated protein C6orf89 homolog [Hypanus sabinus]|uniref:bombesin receptor-activated protein C6orf89 homolog n=1 Tax=Hypanus sabinus TaxID=79690 RepID=UPI0028C49BD6|nr:bombesin receptor-activated protein C6orf89 homolog [Hypanus sabinus]XP_059806433.1 bombesin receptor-activated protein C6orf89 homolog [Hypanus sabinus]XP_059806434.1 bombesin receptor-activated protein C6orf89 homolog [Hypanus sabinus]